jgi:transcriptional regulator with XRE-family HTH domain
MGRNLMHDAAVVGAAIKLAKEGLSQTEISRRLGIARPTVRDWLAGKLPRSVRTANTACPVCAADDHRFMELPESYVYLLGLYLGDGSIAKHPRGVYKLRICLDKKYPGIVDECAGAMRATVPGNLVNRLLKPTNCFEVYAYSRTWPCLFPQHGSGRKHLRRIALIAWQRELVNRWPQALLRGLIQSDGHRFQNTGRGGWICPRYGFTNFSADIRAIFCDGCEQLGVHWTLAGDHTIYVSRKADVATLDRFVGPKR